MRMTNMVYYIHVSNTMIVPTAPYAGLNALKCCTYDRKSSVAASQSPVAVSAPTQSRERECKVRAMG